MPPKLQTPGYSSNIELYGEAESAGLTPRTPYSHNATSTEEGRSRRSRPAIPVNETDTDDEDDETHDEVDLLRTQSHPLLHSSALESSSSGSSQTLRGDEKKSHSVWRTVKDILARDRLPIGLIAGSGVAFFLLFLIFLSIGRPQALLNYMGVNSTAIAYESLDEESKARFNTSAVLDYAASGYTSYPLSTDQYVSECWKVTNDPRMKFYESYWSAVPGTELDVLHKKPTSSQNTCTSSITYFLDGSVGLMGDLAILAQVAMFSHERNRTLFVYDEHWNRGRWTDHFLSFSETQPGPEPGCTPPPPEELVACPRTARHWVISARIAYFHLGDHFQEEFEDAYKYTIERKKPVFDRASQSFSEFIQPNAVNQGLIQRARNEFALLAVATQNLNHSAGIEYISTHIRRGDRKAMSWRYQNMPNAHIPVREYVDAVWNAYTLLQNLSGSDVPIASPLLYLASDSESAASEFTKILVTNDSLVQKYGNENLKPIVYDLRSSADAELRTLAPAVEYVQAEWNNRTEEDRIRETRGVIVDWALLSGAWAPKQGDGSAGMQILRPAATICTLPSNLCKLSAVGLGWNRSFDFNGGDVGPYQRWIEIDNKGGISPIWKPFEIFN